MSAVNGDTAIGMHLFILHYSTLRHCFWTFRSVLIISSQVGDWTLIVSDCIQLQTLAATRKN